MKVFVHMRHMCSPGYLEVAWALFYGHFVTDLGTSKELNFRDMRRIVTPLTKR